MPAEITVDFLRHGIAAERDPAREDAQRALTPEGRERTTAVIQRLQALGWSWQVVLTSPLTRAQQTAQIAYDLGLAQQIQLFPALAPGGAFTELVQWHQHQHQHQLRSVAVVGHQPDLGRWIELALWGQNLGVSGPEPEVIRLKKAGVARVEFPAGQIQAQAGVLCALLRPKLLLKSRQSS